MGVSELIMSCNVVLITSPRHRYKEVPIELCIEITKEISRIGYISFYKSYRTLIEEFEKNNIDDTRFFFVDATLTEAQSPPIVGNCYFISSPSELGDIELAYSSLLTDQMCNIVIVDTISTLLAYHDSLVILKFVHNLITKARAFNKKLVLLAIKESSENILKDLNMLVDAIVEL